MLPVGHAWHDFGFHVGHYGSPVFGVLGGFFWEEFAEVAGFDVGGHAAGVEVFVIVADVVDHVFARLSELVAVHF